MDVDVEELTEPILIDADILDHAEQYQEADHDYTASRTNVDDNFGRFTPGITELRKYAKNKIYKVQENSIEVEESLKKTISITYDFLKSSITKIMFDNYDFIKQNSEVKEEFVHICEKLMEQVENPQNFVNIMEVHNAVRSMISPRMSLEDRELANQTSFIIETVTDWLKMALNYYSMADAQDQPTFKIRHITCGVKLAEWLCHSEDYIKYIWNKKYNLHKELLNLYQQDFMALSIKLMALKALDTYLLHKYAINKFLNMNDNNNIPTENGYFDHLPINMAEGYRVIDELMSQKLVSPIIKFSLESIFIKIKLYEVLYEIHSILIKLQNGLHEITAEEINLITKSLNKILECYKAGPFTISQPNRFLPMSAQFQLMRADSENVFVTYFKMFDLLQCFNQLLTYPSTLNLPAIKAPIFEIMFLLLESSAGLQYLSENIDTINVLLKFFFRIDDEMQYSMTDCLEDIALNLGLEIAYKLQSLYYIECLLDKIPKHSFDCEPIEIIHQLQGLFGLTFFPVGKLSVGEVLGMGDNIKCLLQFLETASAKLEWQELKKSPAIGYIVDLLYFVVVTVSNIHLLEKYTTIIPDVLNLVYDDLFAPKIKEMRFSIAPLEITKSLTYDNISPFVETIERHIETVILYPGSLITCLRIIQYLGISKHSNGRLMSKIPLCNYAELKCEHVIELLYALNGAAILIKLLQTVSNHVETLGLHSSMFISSQCLVLANIVYPTILLLNQLMANIVQCRNTIFRDVTFIPVLLKTYNLLNSFPVNANIRIAQKSKIAIIDNLLVYTRPVSDEVHDKDFFNATLWPHMLGEVIRFIDTAPVSGFVILSESLPLPLAILAGGDLTKDEIDLAINRRKLASAHLQPHRNIIQDAVKKFCISTTQPQLLNLLYRICVQISDVAANSALMIARGIVDTVYASMSKVEGPCSSHVAELLKFLSCLVTHSTVKCAVLQLIHTNSNVTGKPEDKYLFLIPAFSKILKTCYTSKSHIQAQECILSIVQSFCDIDITLTKTSSEKGDNPTPEVYLANAMPIREHLISFITMILDRLAYDNSFLTYLTIMRTLLLLTRHDYGFYHLKENLLNRNALFLVLLKRLTQNVTRPECLSTLNVLVEFLRVCLTIEANDGSLFYNPRSILTIQEVKKLIGWNDSSNEEGSNRHPFLIIAEMLKKNAEEDNSFKTILEGLDSLLKQFINLMDIVPVKEFWQEVVLPAPEPLETQFSCRSLLFRHDSTSRADVKNEKPSALFTATDLSEDEFDELDNIIISSNLKSLLTEVDTKLDNLGDIEEVEEALEKLQEFCIEDPLNPELLYRIGKGHYLVADKSTDKEFIQLRLAKGIEACSTALSITYEHPEVHKWFAALIGNRLEFGSLKEKISDGGLFKIHLDAALDLNPNDHWLHYMMGRFCYDVAGLRWFERKEAATIYGDLPEKLAAAVYGELPKGTYEEAYAHFLEADRLSGNQWKDNKWMLAKCKIAMGDFEEAVEWLQKTSLCKFVVEDKIDMEVKELLTKYSVYILD